LNRLERAAAVRKGAGLFRDLPRGVVAVAGSDRERWLNGMISNDVSGLEPGPSSSGCYATLLTPQGRIVADVQVLQRGDAFWLDLASAAVAPVIERLERYVIADDVELADRSADVDRLGLEGPAAFEIFSRAARDAPRLAPNACADVELAGVSVTVAAFGWSGEAALQFIAPVGAGGAVADGLRAAGAERGLVDSDFEVLEILRIEAGIPRFGAELDESVLPAEAGLDRALSTTKGCYTGQEVVERLRSQGQVSHRLVGLTTAGEAPFDVGAEVAAAGKRVGEVTSACLSPTAGAIALAFVRRASADPGTELQVAGRTARVAALPFAAPVSAGGTPR
jgi:folate-binding protein YgfZ